MTTNSKDQNHNLENNSNDQPKLFCSNKNRLLTEFKKETIDNVNILVHKSIDAALLVEEKVITAIGGLGFTLQFKKDSINVIYPDANNISVIYSGSMQLIIDLVELDGNNGEKSVVATLSNQPGNMSGVIKCINAPHPVYPSACEVHSVNLLLTNPKKMPIQAGWGIKGDTKVYYEFEAA